LDEQLLRVADRSEQLDRLLRDLGHREARLRLRLRRLEIVALAAVEHLGRARGEEPRGLELGLHVDHVALDRGLLRGRRVVADRDVLALELLPYADETRGPRP